MPSIFSLSLCGNFEKEKRKNVKRAKAIIKLASIFMSAVKERTGAFLFESHLGVRARARALALDFSSVWISGRLTISAGRDERNRACIRDIEYSMAVRNIFEMFRVVSSGLS